MVPVSQFSDNCRCEGDTLWLGWRETQADDLASPGEAVFMPTPAECPAAVSGPSSKTLQLLRKRLRQLGRVLLVVTIGLAIAAGALAIWWLNSLNGLPDIGDPFDVAEFRAFRIPDEQNAFTLVRRADEKLTLMPLSVGLDDPRVHDWFEANRPLVDLFIQAAECADGISGPEDVDNGRYYPIQNNWGGLLFAMTYHEGGRRADSGNMAGAWDCYRAILRMYVHLRRRERLAIRWRADVQLGELQQRLAKWAADPRTTIPQIRRALEEVIACRPRPEWDAFTLKREYLDLMQFLEGPVNPPPEQIEEEWTYRLGDVELPADLKLRLHSIKRQLAREPQRSRRVIRLLFANWLAHVENTDPQRRRPAVRARFYIAQRTANVALYPVGPDAPAGARALSPQEVASWLVTTNDARVAFAVAAAGGGALWPAVRQMEQRGYRELLVLLASELYHRERGTLPPSEDALVGTYLESLPDDGSAELGDETTPTVSDSASSAQPPPR
jgi:hypothetical protein